MRELGFGMILAPLPIRRLVLSPRLLVHVGAMDLGQTAAPSKVDDEACEETRARPR